MNLRAIIFDYGEVLSGPPDPQAHQNLLEISGLPEPLFEQCYWQHRLDYDADILNGQTYWEKVARDAGIQFTAGQIEQLNEQDARMWMNINGFMLAWITELKNAGLRLGILSNMGDEVLRHVRQFPWLREFDHCTWSCELRIVKPNPAIYLHTVDKLGVSLDEALFIDNLEKNVAAAEAVGLPAILFQSAEQLGRDLRRRGFDLPLGSLQQNSEIEPSEVPTR